MPYIGTLSLQHCSSSSVSPGNKHLKLVKEIKEIVLIESRPGILVQGHGDYHLKNIYIKKEEGDEFVAAIDFDSSYQVPRAFDVGTFLAQYDNMFFNDRDIQVNVPSDIFLEAYLKNIDDPQ